jgi:ribosome-binding protein aMBF1 (putative translation factor)
MKMHEKQIKAIAKRIKKVRGEMSRKAFASTIEEKASSLQNYEEGQWNRDHTIPVDVLLKISNIHRINILWLIEGHPHKKEKTS